MAMENLYYPEQSRRIQEQLVIVHPKIISLHAFYDISYHTKVSWDVRCSKHDEIKSQPNDIKLETQGDLDIETKWVSTYNDNLI